MNDIENLVFNKHYTEVEKKKALPFFKSLLKEVQKTSTSIDDNWYKQIYIKLRRKLKQSPSKSILSIIYQELLGLGKIKRNIVLENIIRNKTVRSRSGVVPVAIVMKPSKFSCPYNCYMCPDERIENGATIDMPRSYLSTEPAEMRAAEVDFDTIKQFQSRLKTLQANNHELDKVEIIVLGGTFSTYPRSYQEEFVRDTFYAANTFFDSNPRFPLKLEEEQILNEDAKCHIVGFSIETRPDQINKNEIKRLRNYGVTRVQMGIQHTKNEILDIINRQHHVEHSIKAIKMLKNVGFKLELHIMPDLPGTTPKEDIKMINDVLLGENFQPDYLKIYPCLDVKYTEIRQWKKDGRWKPYAEKNGGKELFEVLEYALENIPYWTRDSRVQRDFPEEHDNNNHIGFKSDNIKSNLYQLLLDRLKSKNKKCKSIRNREVKNKILKNDKYYLFIEKYNASDGIEYFISYESIDRSVLYGFVRLRFNNEKKNIFNCLIDSAIVRELHVYGMVTPVSDNKNHTQHQGLGKKLMKIAEFLAKFNKLYKISVISSVGTRKYYKKLGYKLNETYMTKELKNPYFYNSVTNWKLNMNKFKKNFKKLNIYFMLGFMLTITLSVIIKHFY